ncbi:MAG TPA: hypothetical protein VD837_16400 [Terriglobales bacterium]|nr:hypothetical protein [Terriglobales bacterium]
MRNLKLILVLVSLAVVACAQNIGAVGATPASTGASSTAEAAAQQSPPDPLLDVPPLPNTQVTLVGGIVTGIDRVKNKITVEAFGGKKMKMFFDERSHIYRDGVETTQLGIKKGDRVYVDTQLDGSEIFARNIRVQNTTGPADARGQLVSYNAKRGTIVLRDELSAQPVTFLVDSKTTVAGKGNSMADLAPGSLVTIQFSPESPDGGKVEQIVIAARPGETFTFAGNVTHLDLSRGIIAIKNQSDGKTYDVEFDPRIVNAEGLLVGAEVTISATFDGSAYTTRNINVVQARR